MGPWAKPADTRDNATTKEIKKYNFLDMAVLLILKFGLFSAILFLPYFAKMTG
jgi:hypothetical protein